MDPKLENVQNRHPLRPVLDRIIEARTSTSDTKTFFEEFQSHRLAASPINSPSAFLEDPQTKHRQYVVEIDPYLGRHRFPGDPYKFSESPWRIERGAPLLGEHQQAVTNDCKASPWYEALRGISRQAARSLPFAGIRVLSFPTGIVGPALGSLLAEHGAEVITVEAGRTVRSPQRGQRFQIASDLESHRNKKRIAINMKHPEGRSPKD